MSESNGVAFPAVESQLDTLIDQARTDSGFTINPRDGIAPTAGYVVATDLATRVEDAAVFFGDSRKEVIKRYLWANAAILKSHSELDMGVWYDRTRERVVLSIVALVADREAAISLGRRYCQRAVYDLAAGSEILTGKPGRWEASYPPSRR